MFLGSRVPSEDRLQIINLSDSDEEKGMMNLSPGVTASRIKSSGSSSVMNLDPLRSSTRRPGQVPPFAVFSQEKRGKLQELHPEYNFGELGRRLSEMWHALSEDEKEHYRKKARMIGAQKLKAWDDKMKRSNHQQPYFIQQKPPTPSASASSGTIKRRRTHGYAIFMSEERKKHSTVNVPLGDVTRKVAEAWRSLDPTVRATYEAKANRINAIENRRYQQALLLQQRNNARNNPQTLRIASVESLSSPRPPAVKPNVNLPSGITISRVEPESSESKPKNNSALPPRMMLPRGSSVQQAQTQHPKGLIDMRLNGGDHSNSGGGLIDVRGGGVRGGPPKMMGGRLSHYPPPLQRRPTMMPMSYALPGTAGMPMKRVMPPGAVAQQPMAKRAKHIIPPRPPLMRQGMKPANPSSIGILGTLDTWDKMCRLCGRTLIPIVPIHDDLQILEKVRDYLGMNLDLEDDKDRGYPPGICRKCSGMLNGFDRFKKVVSQGQGHLDELAKMKREKMGLGRKSTEMVNYDGTESILPDLDIEIEDNVPRPMLPRPKNVDSDTHEENHKINRFSSKSGDEEDEGSVGSSRSSMVESNGKEGGGGESVVENDDDEDEDLDPDFDPLNFLQVSDVVGDYEESSPNGKVVDDEKEEEEDEANSEKSSDDIQIANAIYESLMDQSAEESSNGGDDAKKDFSAAPTPVHMPESGDDNANDCDGEKEEVVLIDGGANSKNGEESSSKLDSASEEANGHELTNGNNESDDSNKALKSRSMEDVENDIEEEQQYLNQGEDKSPDDGVVVPLISDEDGKKGGGGEQVQSMIDEEEKYIENEMEEEEPENGGGVSNGSGPTPPQHFEGMEPEEDEEEDPFPEPPMHVNFDGEDFINHDGGEASGGQPVSDFQEDDPL